MSEGPSRAEFLSLLAKVEDLERVLNLAAQCALRQSECIRVMSEALLTLQQNDPNPRPL